MPPNAALLGLPQTVERPIIARMSAPPADPQAPSRQLTSWKEIAGYLNRDIRTVQRWEKREGLPVHRQLHESRPSISVTTAELDAWTRQRTVGPASTRPLVWWKSWRLWLAAAAAFAGILAIVAWRFPQRREVALRPLELEHGLRVAGTPSWDGRFVPYISAKRQQAELFLHDTETGQSRIVYRLPEGLPADIADAAASPDGSQIAYALLFKRGGGQLRIVRSDGSGDRPLLSDPKYLLSRPSGWSPDGRSILATLWAPNMLAADVAILDASNGSYRVLHHADAFQSNPPRISPDGRFAAYNQGGDIYAVRTQGGDPVAVTTGTARDALLGWAPDGRVVFQSDRSGTQDLWAVPWDGKPGEAQLLWRDLPMVGVGTTLNGNLFFVRRARKDGLVAAKLVDGRLAAPPAPLPATRFEYGNRMPDFSPMVSRWLTSPPSRVKGRGGCFGFAPWRTIASERFDCRCRG